MEEVNKYVYEFPVFEDYFVASVKKAKFLSSVLEKVYEMLEKNSVSVTKDAY
jgi:hypothetical protein